MNKIVAIHTVAG